MSDRPEHPTADRRPDTADPAAPSPAAGATEPAGPEVGEPAETTARGEPTPTEAGNEAAASAPFDGPAATAAATRRSRDRGLVLGWAASLLIVLALVGTAPLWAPLLPWGGGRSGVDPAIVDRLDAEQQQIQALRQQIASATTPLTKLEQRVGALEQKPPAPPPELDEMRQRIAAVSAGASDLTTRLERLANSVQAQAAGVADVTSRLARTEQAQQTRIADLAAKLDPLQQALATQQSSIADMGNRLQSVEKTARSRAGDLTDMGLALALLQLRNAIDAGRPFPAEYDALSSLATARPEITAAAAPLATASATGVATNAALAQELRALGPKIDVAAASSAPVDGGWTGAVLERLGGLIKIRRADEAGPGKAAEAAITGAERALAEGDLARAVAAVGTLPGPAAASAEGWLRQARERLAVEEALRQLRALLTGRLGGDTAATPGAPG